MLFVLVKKIYTYLISFVMIFTLWNLGIGLILLDLDIYIN